MFENLGRGALGDHLAAVYTSPGAEVDDVITGHDRLFVVLDDQYRIAEIPQVCQRCQQSPVIALVQADRGLIEDVHHADQAGADLAGQPDPLGFAARERLGTAIERQVFEPDIREKS